MAREKFKIKNSEDWFSAYKYLDKRIKDEYYIEKKGAKEAYNKIFTIEGEKRFERMTEFCNMFLNEEQNRKLKNTIRQNRILEKGRHDIKYSKKQITVHWKTHMRVEEYAKCYNITIDEAINKLCDNITEL